MKLPVAHWSEVIATELQARGPKRPSRGFRLQSSLSPSGPLHIGNFRDTIVVWAVAQTLKARGERAEFLLCFDDADVLKRSDLPPTEVGKPLSEVQISGDSYSKAKVEAYLEELTRLGLSPETVTFQAKVYFESAAYEPLIAKLVRRKEALRKILNRYRDVPLKRGWHPLVVHCETCWTLVPDAAVISGFWRSRVTYDCKACGYAHRASLRATKRKKLTWRADFPMRCHFEQTDFEPCGEDHACDGSTMTTSRDILKEIFGDALPLVRPYGFVRLSGATRKISASHGRTVTLADLLDVYSAPLVLWLMLRAPLASGMVLDMERGRARHVGEYRRFLDRIANGQANASDRHIHQLIGRPSGHSL